MNALVSVIIPVYNCERYVGEAMESVLSQTCSNFELIVVDDGSDDGTAEVVKSFGTQVRYFYQENGGVSAARNTGIKLARGDYLAFLDADDLWMPDKLEMQLTYLGSNPEVPLVGAHAEFFLQPEQEIPSSFRKELLQKDRACFLLQAILARRSLFEAVGLFDTKLSTAEDVEWLARVKDGQYPCAVIPRVLLRKRVHNASISFSDHRDPSNILTGLRRSVERKKRSRMQAPEDNPASRIRS